MLSIHNLQVSVEEKPILQGLNLEIGPGEVHGVEDRVRDRPVARR